MKLDQYFSAPRFFQLLKIETYSGYKRILIVGAATFAFLFLIAMVNGEDRDFEDFHSIFYPLVLLGGGFLYTSRIFNELNSPNGRMSYLGLPASNFEKLSVKWFVSAIIYTIIVTIAYWIFATITNGLINQFWSFEFYAFEPFSELNRMFIGLYIVIQSVFLLGAIAFNKYALPKTILSLFILEIILASIVFILFRITFNELFDGFFTPADGQPPIQPNDNLKDFVSGPLWNIAQSFFWFVLAPVLWVVSYFKLKEREV